MAAKKTNEAPGKTDFVRNLPDEVPPDEVVTRAKEAGIEISKNDVWSIRAKLRARRGKVTKPAGRPKSASGAAPKKSAAPKKASASPDAPMGKTDFVRDLPVDLPVAEVLARAKAAGVDLTAKRLSTIRSTLRAQEAKAAAKKRAARKAARVSQPKQTQPASPPTVSKQTSPAPPLSAPSVSKQASPGRPPFPTTGETQFVELMLNIGLHRAKELVALVEKQSASFLHRG